MSRQSWLHRFNPAHWQRRAAFPDGIPADPLGPLAVHPANSPESSLSLRAAVLVNSLVAIGAFGLVEPDEDMLGPFAVAFAGAVVSYWRRTHRNLGLKAVLALGMLAALWLTLGNLVSGVLDPRQALAKLLLWLQLLNGFDLPRRRNLRVSMMVATVLMIVTATLSRESEFGLLLGGFALTWAWVGMASFHAETGAPPGQASAIAQAFAGILALGLLLSGPLFLAMPRKARSFEGEGLPMSIRLPLPAELDARVQAAIQQARSGRGDGARRRRGEVEDFAEELDLNGRSFPTDEIVLRVASDLPPYLRAVAYDWYDGQRWRMRDQERVTELDAGQTPLRLKRPPGQSRGPELAQTIYVERDHGNMIFAAWNPTQLYFPTPLVWRDQYDSLRSPVRLDSAMHYSVVSEPPALVTARNRATQPAAVPPALAPYLGLPRVSARVRQLAGSLTGTARGPFAVMQNLTIGLQERCTYDLEVPPPGAGQEVVDTFLFEQRRGFCQHFASALAVCGRLQGIPTRLVTGYAPGDYNALTGLWEVRGKHAHAWVEAWLPGVGWFPFDATPSDWNMATAFREPATARAQMWREGARWAALAMGPAALWLMFSWLRRAWRRPARRRDTGVTLAYRRLQRQVARLGGPAPEADLGPREWLVRVQACAHLEPARAAIDDFLAQYERARFGAPEGTVAWQDAYREAQQAMRACRSRTRPH
ncbi:MAG: transglutaminaseTgpA domain-containing protein [Candidatus Sericytochromatia bacterium]|nr:transglutaminaseTgpA domain-containing protein [Candidatus Sericytochromatia bacterium]